MGKGISVIVCCYNSAKRLPETLDHLIRQKINGIDWEIIVVDNASTDSTTETAKKILSDAAPSVSYKVIGEPEPGLINARNRGFANSSFEFVLFCDDDNWLSETYLQTAFNLMSSNLNMGILGGCGEAVFEESKPDWFDDCRINFAVGDQAPEQLNIDLVKLEHVYGAGFMIRRRLFDELETGNFRSLLSGRKGNQLISGEDSELCWVAQQLGYEIWYYRKLHFKHLMTKGRMKWGYIKKLYFGFGRANIYTQAYYHFNANKGLPNFDLRLPFWLDTYVHKLKVLLLFLPRVLFHFREVGNKDVLKFYGMRGELYELWNLKEKYNEVFLNIMKMKQKLASMKRTV